MRSQKPLGLLVAAVIGALAAWAPTPGHVVLAQTAVKSDAWTATECSTFKLDLPEDSPIECGYVTAPLRHAEPDGPTIQLAVVVLPASGDDRQSDPLVMAQGGPGGSTIDTYAQYLATDSSMRPTLDRDIVLWDQRGTLYSVPSMLCPEASEAELQGVLASSAPEAAFDETAAYEACGTRLATEVGDLSAFNSSENADDVEDVRAALGYDEFNFYGVSYGTELGQFVMRQQPDHLRSVVLDAVVPLSYNLFSEPAFAKERIAEKYFNGCAEDPQCNAAFPNLAERYLALIDRLNEDPAEVTVFEGDPFSFESAPQARQVILDGSLLESALYESLYSDVRELVPLIIDQADKGNYTFLAAALLPLMLFDDTLAVGMHLTVACADRGDTDMTSVDYSGLDEGLAHSETEDAEAELAICKAWNIELLPRDDLEPVVSDIPALLLSGDFDPITPPQYAETLLPNLANATHVIFPGGSHGQAVTNPCANGIITSFLDDPTGEIDTNCAEQPMSGYLTEDDIVPVPSLRSALDESGVRGLLKFLGSVAPSLLVGLFLLTAIPVYFIGWLIGLIRKPEDAEAAVDWTKGWSRWAPWIAFLAALLLIAFVGLLGAAMWMTLAANQNMLLLGALPSAWRPIFVLPLLFVVLAVAMVIAAIALWAGHRRSMGGRIYYVLLTLAAISSVLAFYRLGILGLGLVS